MPFMNTEQVYTNSGKCKYCYLHEKLVIGTPDEPENENYGISLLSPNYLFAYGYGVKNGGSNYISVIINYCPMCGKKLINKDS